MKKIHLLVLIAVLQASPANALGYFLDSKPQSTSNTCQAYSLMMALAFENHDAFQMETASDLRAIEQDFRQKVDSLPGSSYSHKNWSTALEQYVQGHYVLKRKYYKNELDWRKKVAELTGTGESLNDPTLSALLSKKVVMTSVKSLEGNRYKSGHIVGILGIEKSTNSQATTLFFNSAIKGNGKKNSCDQSDVAGDYRYKAGLIKTNKFQLKPFGINYLLMWLEAV